jgi:pimeloyl-ACP methyl ester carboxylesterase
MTAWTRFLRPPNACQILTKPSFLFVLILGLAPLAEAAQRPKNITGVVSDLGGRPIPSARVFVRDLASGVLRTHVTGEDGIYAVNGLPSNTDYEIYVEFESVQSERRIVSQFLDRVDNVLNFDVEISLGTAIEPNVDRGGMTLETFDLVQLRASFEIPQGIPAPIPAALLIHGYGESRSVWDELKQRLLVEGWAVMTLDLRGHGQSRVRNAEPIDLDPRWRSDPRQFPLDLEPALDWLKSQERLDSNAITVIGTDVGANLALLASSRFPEVRSAVAISPVLDEALRMAGTAREFSPRMAHLMVSDREQGQAIREFVTGASRVSVIPAARGTADWLVSSGTIDEIVRWLRDTY